MASLRSLSLLQVALVTCAHALSGSCPTQGAALIQRTTNIHQDLQGGSCAAYSSWPNVDGGVTCPGCTALVLTAPYGGRCDKYCQSFGHVCVAAADESGESCDVQATKRCDEAITGTSDMLCTCQQGAPAPAAQPQCAAYGSWPDVDGVTCPGCMALVLTAPYGGRCDHYCQSFGHVCVGAAEESGESCDVQSPKRCDEAITGTSDMLCSCSSQSGAVPAPAPMPVGGKPMEVRVVSYNLYWWNAFGKNPWKGNRITDNIKGSLRADVMGFQECDSPGLIKSRTGLVPASPFKGAQGVSVRPGLFEVGDTGAADLQAAGKWGTRYATWARLTHKATGRSFWIFNTHWCVHSGNGRSCSASKRYVGAQNMLRTIQEKARGEPVLITGDFNAEMHEPGPRHFLKNGFSLAKSSWVDAVFYSSAHWRRTWAGTGSKAESDHRPVIAELTLK